MTATYIGNFWSALGLATVVCLLPIIVTALIIPAGLARLRGAGNTNARGKNARGRNSRGRKAAQQDNQGCLGVGAVAAFATWTISLYVLAVAFWWVYLTFF